MKISLSDHFTYRKLMRFTMPSIVMMLFTSVYSVVDGFFVSTFAGKTPFAAVNFIMPFLIMLGALGFMFGAGGSALVAKTLGEGESQRANRIFSLVIYASIAVGILLTVLGIAFIRPVAILLGAEGQMLEDAVVYGRIILAPLVFFMLQMEFQSFFITAEKPNLGLITTVMAGVANMVLDALLVGGLSMGLVGAAVATAVSQFIGGAASVLYFMFPNRSLLRLTRTNFDGGVLLKTCVNGSSELMSNISMSLVGMLFNLQLLKYAGEDGVAAYGVLMYVGFAFVAIFIGYSIGTAPVVGYHYGAQNHGELKSLLRKSAWIIGITSVSMVMASLLLSAPLSTLFVGYDAALLEMTKQGFLVYSLAFLFMGFSIFSSGFFTALNDGVTSAIISFFRTVVFQVAAVLLLPLLWGIDGIWWSIVVAEGLAVAVSAAFVIGKRKKYHYL